MASAQADAYYPPVGFYFNVDVTLNEPVKHITGNNEGNFQEVSGINVKLGVKEVEEGGENRFVHKFPVPPKYDNLILKRGMLKGSPLINWAKTTVEQFNFKTATVVVSLMDEEANPLATWKFTNAYPVGIKISDFKAQENAIVVETLELCYDYFKKEK
jgi:phage tail-like protein